MSSSPQETLRRSVGSTNSAPPSARITQPQEVEWFGAVGDGTTDDTAAIAAAILAAGAYGIVLFKPGKTYKTTSQIVITAAGVTLLGYGATITSATSAQYQKFRFSSAARGAVIGIKFNCIYVSGATSIAAGVVELWNSSDIQVQDCEFNDVSNVGVYLYGTTTRAVIAFNRFYKNFAAIFSDDDLTNQPTLCQIIGNQIRTGLGTTSTSLSAGIKLSGIGSTTTKVGHVISDNVIDAPGQMGIEIQTYVNDCSITGNTIYGAGYGISLSGVERGSVIGNTVRNSTTYGIELATACKYCAVTGNTITGTTNIDGIVTSQATTACSITGNTIQNASIHTVESTKINISSNNITEGLINIQNCSSVVISSNIVISAAVAHAVVIDVSGSSGTKSGFTITNNDFVGAFTFSIIRLFSSSGSATIDALLITGNNTVLASTGATGFDMVFSGSTTYTTNCRNYGNIGLGNGYHGGLLNLDVETVTASTTAVFNRKLYLVDATAGAKVITLPDATRNFGIKFGVKKIDATANTVTVNTVDGGAHVLTAQNEYMWAVSTAYGVPAWALIGDN